MPGLTRTTADLPRGAAPVGPAEYERVIAGVREAVARAVPPGSIVLVASRGDEELVRFPDHRGWHFPRTVGGEYGGYHPESGRDAIAHLEELRSAGAAFLVFPRTAFWWFDYYGELVEYLRQNARRLVEDREACLIFAFEGRSATAGSTSPAMTTTSKTTSPAHRLAGLVDALLPGDCPVAVAAGEFQKLPVLGERAVWRFALPDPASVFDPSSGVDLAKQLEAFASVGILYLVVPRGADDLIRLNPTFGRLLEAKCRVVTRQRYLGIIYALRESPPIHGNGDRSRRGEEARWP